MPNSRLHSRRTPSVEWAPGAPLTPVALAVLAAGLMLVLAVATVAAVTLDAPLAVSIPLAVASLAVRPCAVLFHRRRSLDG